MKDKDGRMKHYRKKSSPSMQQAIFFLVVGLLLGTVFTFGMSHWNEEIPRESCKYIETEFLDYHERHPLGKPSHIKEIMINCSNGERYFIDGVSINKELRNAVGNLSEGERIRLLIHPNSDTILELSCNEGLVLEFKDTIKKLGQEKNGFGILGVVMYFFAFVGLYHIVAYQFSKKKKRKSK